MNKRILILIIGLILINKIMAFDNELFTPVLGDKELYANQVVGDNGTGAFYTYLPPTAPVIPVTPSGGGGGGGGGGLTTEKLEFNIFPQIIQSFLPKEKDDIKEVTIYNNGTTELSLKLEVTNLDNIVNLSSYYIKIPPKQNGIIQLNILKNNQMPGVYTGELRAISKSLVRVIPIVIEIESESPLFDVDTEISSDYIEIEESNPLVSKITLINKANTGKNVDANVTYLIKDFSGNILYEEKEVVSLEDVITYNKEFKLNLKSGDYLLALEAEYGNTTAVSSSTFKVIPKTIQGVKKNAFLIYLGIFGFLIIILIITMLNYRRISRFRIKKPDFDFKEKSLDEKLKIIDEAYKGKIIKK